MAATYLIPEQNEAKAVSRLESLAAKARKLGLAPLLYALVHTFTRPDTRRDALEGAVITYKAYTVSGDAPVINGWAFAATIEHTEHGNILRAVTDHLPREYRDAEAKCDHCGTVRRRKDTYVVVNESGEYKQVGRSCLKDFLGHKSPEAIADYYTALYSLDLEDECEEPSFGGGGADYEFELHHALAITSYVISACGWLSRSAAGYEEVATADHVWAALTATRAADHVTPTDSNRADATAALAWLAEQDNANDYIYNCQTIAKSGVVTYRTIGFAASIVSSYLRAMERQVRKAVLKADGSEHIGTEGKREEFTLTLLGVSSIEGFYGTTHIHRFADTDGNSVVWFASNPEVVPCSVAHPDEFWGADESRKTEMVQGATYRVKATVKEHGEYKGQNQTKLSRVAVQPLVKVKKARKSRSKKAA